MPTNTINDRDKYLKVTKYKLVNKLTRFAVESVGMSGDCHLTAISVADIVEEPIVTRQLPILKQPFHQSSL